jgi:hypothetical protein
LTFDALFGGSLESADIKGAAQARIALIRRIVSGPIPPRTEVIERSVPAPQAKLNASVHIVGNPRLWARRFSAGPYFVAAGGYHVRVDVTGPDRTARAQHIQDEHAQREGTHPLAEPSTVSVESVRGARWPIARYLWPSLRTQPTITLEFDGRLHGFVSRARLKRVAQMRIDLIREIVSGPNPLRTEAVERSAPARRALEARGRSGLRSSSSPSRPDLRASDYDRDAVVAALSDHYSVGRLSKEEFDERVDAAFRATTIAELDRLMDDLP